MQSGLYFAMVLAVGAPVPGQNELPVGKGRDAIRSGRHQIEQRPGAGERMVG